MELSQLKTKNYKSIDSWEQITINETNVLIGKNNTGKSSVIDAIRDYREAFPVGNEVDGEWVAKRVTRERGSDTIVFQFDFELKQEERERLFQYFVENDLFSETEVDRFDESDFRQITHELKLGSPPDGPRVNGESNMYTDFDGNEIALRKGDLSENQVDYINFNTLPNVEYTNNRKNWVKVKEILENSMNSWEFIDAFRNPKNLIDAEEKSNLESSGKNLSQVLLTLVADNNSKFNKIANTYSSVMEGVEDVKAPLRNDQTTVAIEELEFDDSFDLDEISAGSKEILTLITQIVLASEECDMVLIEEPELHLHPGAQREIFELIEGELAGGPQVLISTHSSEFVDHDRVDNIISVKRQGKTQLSQANEGEVNKDLKELGYQYSGMLQSDAVVIVEGTTDKTILNSMAEKYDFNLEDNRIGVADMGNSVKLVDHSRSLVKILSVFSIPYLFICDADISEQFDDAEGELSSEAIRGKIIEHINRSDDDIWWEKADTDDVHVWKEEEEIEGYLLADREAIKQNFTLDDDEIVDILDDSPGLDPDEQLQQLCEEARPHISSELSPMNKKTDTADLADCVDLNNIPKEFHDVMYKIAELVDRGDIIDKKDRTEHV